jgi:hypothetical protein
MMQALELGIPTQQTELDLPVADDIKINDAGPTRWPPEGIRTAAAPLGSDQLRRGARQLGFQSCDADPTQADAISPSARSSQNRMSISRYMVVEVVRWSRALSDWPPRRYSFPRL